MKFLNPTIFRIWFPFALITLLAASLVGLYFVHEQSEHLIEHKQDELKRLLPVVGGLIGNVSLSEAFGHVLDSVSAQAEIAVILYRRPSRDRLEIRYATGGPAAGRELLSRQDPLIFAETEMRSGARFPEGDDSLFLRLTARREQALRELDHLLLPVFLVIALLAGSCMFLFFVVAYWISRPLTELKEFSAALLRQEYSRPLSFRYGLREVGELKDDLNRLRQTLDEQRTRNQELTSGLEFQVAKRTQELKTLIQRLNDAQSIALIGNFQYWIDHDTWEFSANVDQILGAGASLIEGIEGLMDRVPDDVRDKIRSRFITAVKGRTRIEIDFPISSAHRLEGAWVSVIGDCRLDPEVRMWCISGTIQDITVRHRIEDQIDRLSLVARLTTNGVIITDTRGIIIWVNQGMTKLTGYDYAEMVGQTPRMFQSKSTDAVVRSRIARQLQEQRSIREELENITKDGRPYWIELHIEPFYDSFGSLQGFMAIQVDITQRKQYEHELRVALDKATELSEIKSKFVSMASHEFRTPLTTILSSAELLVHVLEQSQELNRSKLMRYVSRITGEGDRLAGLINDVLILGRQEAGKIPFRPVQTDVSALVSELFADRQVVENDDRQLEISFRGTQRLLCLDPALIGQTLTNLVTNALKYSRGSRAPHMVIDYREDRLVIQVQDFGIGIPEEDQKHLFETFYRGANVENIPGTGLGLSIVRQFTELHHGEIIIKIRVNSGTSVTLEFVYEELRKFCQHIA